MHTKGPVYCKAKDVGTKRQEYWRKKWRDGTNNHPAGQHQHLGWSKTKVFFAKLQANLGIKKTHKRAV